jgi:hypothetical protein
LGRVTATIRAVSKEHLLTDPCCRNQGYNGGYGEDGKDRRSTDPQDSDSDSELDIEGPSSPSDLRDEDGINTSGDRDRSREESGSEDDPLTKTSPPGAGGLAGGLHGWPAHPAFATAPPNLATGPAPALSAQTLNKITSQFWGFDPSRPPLPPHLPLDSLSFPLSFPSLQSSLSSHLFKLPPDSEASRQMFRFRSST